MNTHHPWLGISNRECLIESDTPHRNLPLEDLLRRLNSLLRGWTAYFRPGVSSTAFNYLRGFVWRQVFRWLRRKHPRTTWKELRRRYCDGGWWPADGEVTLFNPGAVRTTRYRYRGTNIASPWPSTGGGPERRPRRGLWRAGCVDEAHVRFGRRAEETGRSKDRLRASVRPHYHRRVHSETGQTPWDRWSAITPPLPSPARLREAFLWSEWRTVTKTATVGLHGNLYQVDAALVGRRVELVFDPFDLTDIEVRWQNRPMGPAVPHRIGRHVHAKARPDESTPPPAPTGIDYLRLVEARHAAELAERVRYSRLPDRPAPGQPAPRGTGDDNDAGEVSA